LDRPKGTVKLGTVNGTIINMGHLNWNFQTGTSLWNSKYGTVSFTEIKIFLNQSGESFAYRPIQCIAKFRQNGDRHWDRPDGTVKLVTSNIGTIWDTQTGSFKQGPPLNLDCHIWTISFIKIIMFFNLNGESYE